MKFNSNVVSFSGIKKIMKPFIYKQNVWKTAEMFYPKFRDFLMVKLR